MTHLGRLGLLVLMATAGSDEMQNCFIGVLVDPKIDPAGLFSPLGPSLLPPGVAGPTLSAFN